jgi:hypothetical protein
VTELIIMNAAGKRPTVGVSFSRRVNERFPHPFLKKFKSHRLRMMILAIADEGRSATTVFPGGKFDCRNIHGGTN